MTPVIVRNLGLRDYLPVWQAMQSFTEARNDATVDEIWLLEHPPVFTQGRAGKAKHLLAPGDIPVIQIDRGGQVTYHGPGQLVTYLLLDIRRRNMGVRQLVRAIEQAVVDTLAEWGIAARAEPDAPGVYVEGAKIASLGLRIRRGCTYHGLSLNVDMNLEPFGRINPCGYAGLKVTQIKALDGPPGMATVAGALLSHLTRHLRYTIMIDDSGVIPGENAPRPLTQADDL